MKIILTQLFLIVGIMCCLTWAKNKDKDKAVNPPPPPPKLSAAHLAEMFKDQRDLWIQVAGEAGPAQRVEQAKEVLKRTQDRILKEEQIDLTKWQLNGETGELEAVPPPPPPPPDPKPAPKLEGRDPVNCGGSACPPPSAPAVPPVDTPK